MCTRSRICQKGVGYMRGPCCYQAMSNLGNSVDPSCKKILYILPINIAV